ncbi:MAG: hypothetical protein DRG78_11320 [Epsilonproteobacteria bacterium]|nr:MAG: hypothetical protein DRG78_11320 [Campylobacterota bacterium]
MNTDKIIDLTLQFISSLKESVNEVSESTQGIEWVPVAIVADLKGLTADAIRKQLKSGDFEEGVDFKYKGSRIEVHQGAIGRIRRKRRSSNG